ncbi:spore cortex-lytic enzyme [Tepidibacter thalassicus]|uniref:Spore cortex-lytic enzyme n=1 Tax=Tepidibacter thalassicus DSM 15285 TaxID=1123350 RepID=A0A1M5S2I9_9FIRM|nr:spore cortex-lytic enzyme [Tepidibacter thalassicus]SHH32852.1 N-acetylmuramoyl-L-alanine amidase [Tepidibacter thalassicus DSM 15285]
MKKALLFMSVFFIISLLAITFYVDDYIAYGQANIFWGSRGTQVKTVQSKLKRWGYYDGAVDGIYGYRTYLAIRKFQKKHNLKVDGIVGNATKKALGIPVKSNKTPVSRNDDVYLLSKAITGEARGEPYVGQVAVGAVILNRTKDPRFPHSIAGVIYQPGAFTAVDDGQINLNPTESAIRAARDAINGWDPTGGAIYYWNPATATSKWIWRLKPTLKIGKHWFAKGPY